MQRFVMKLTKIYLSRNDVVKAIPIERRVESNRIEYRYIKFFIPPPQIKSVGRLHREVKTESLDLKKRDTGVKYNI